MNKFIGMGRLTRDPDIRYANTQNGQTCVARYNLAIDRRGKDNGTDFISCVAFGRSGEFAEKYLKKGTKILVCGRVQTGSYKNRDGQTVYTTDVVVEEHYFAESKSAAGMGTQRNDEQADSDGFMNIPDGVEDEGLPFN